MPECTPPRVHIQPETVAFTTTVSFNPLVMYNNLFPFLFARNPETHKGDYGHALLIAGSYGKMGAAVLAARAALRSGVGLLTVHVPRQGVAIMQTAVPEAMLSIDNGDTRFSSLPANLERYNAIAVGPGLGTDAETTQALLCLLESQQPASLSHHAQLILDADALNIVARHPEAMHLVAGSIITPHAREYERLFGDADTQSMADLHDLVIVRKAHRTRIYAPHSHFIENTSGNAGMATAGSGDVLTGIMLGLAAQWKAYRYESSALRPSRQQLAARAVDMHGKAGDVTAMRRGNLYSLVAGDIVNAL